jgi:hypothetical protein
MVVIREETARGVIDGQVDSGFGPVFDAFADAEHGVGFAFINNQMGGIPDDRARPLAEALKGCLHA